MLGTKNQIKETPNDDKMAEQILKFFIYLFLYFDNLKLISVVQIQA